jgi:TIGR03009 family protein
VTRTDVSPITRKPTTFVGEAAFMKPNMARIDLTHQDEVGKKDSEKTNFERLICNGQNIFEYVPKDKLIVVHDMPNNNAVDDNLILSFMKGMKVAAAKQRFTFVLTKETEWYSYVTIAPKTEADRQEFAMAQLTIWAKSPYPQGPDVSMLPVRVWYKQPNGKEVTYTFDNMRPNANLNRSSFAPMGIEGYTVKKAAAPAVANNPKPPTIRNQQMP